MVETSTDVTADVVVIGGGFAGLSAAVRLAEAGRHVVVVEAAPRLGGRASTFTDRETGERVDNGQHVLFGCYRETYAFLKRIGTDRLAPLDRTLAITMAGNDGRTHRLSCPRLPTPWHLVAGILNWRAVSLRDRVSAFRLASVLRNSHLRTPHLRTSALPHSALPMSVSDWLRAHGQSPELCRWLWNPLAFAALNQSPDIASAGPFVRVLAEMFGPAPEDSAVGLPAAPLDEVYALPSARLIEERGGFVLTGMAARIALDPSGRIARVRVGERSVATQTVISAVPWHAVSALWDDSVPAPLASLCGEADRMQPSPIVTVNFWFDRRVMDERFVGLVDGAMHWAFDKSAIVGEGTRHVSVVSSGAGTLATMANDEIVAVALDQLGRALPAVRAGRVERSLVVKERRATFSLAPGEPARPSTTTPLPGFFLAGDWVDTGLPATIESAVASGHAAADAVIDDGRRPG